MYVFFPTCCKPFLLATRAAVAILIAVNGVRRSMIGCVVSAIPATAAVPRELTIFESIKDAMAEKNDSTVAGAAT